MCEPLADFTSRLYSKFDLAAKREPLALNITVDRIESQLPEVTIAELGRNNAMVSVKMTGPDVPFLPYDKELAYEATVVSRIAKILVESSNLSLFVITPHKAQKSAVSEALSDMIKRNPENKIKVDTVDRMQGQEADVVIVVYSFLSQDRVESELDFVFGLNRINVAISRAKKLVVLLCGDLVVRAPIAVAATHDRQQAFGHLLHFYENSVTFPWRYRVADDGFAKGLQDDV